MAGLGLTAVFVIWFVSGAVFVYVGMPTLPAEKRLKRIRDSISAPFESLQAKPLYFASPPSRFRVCSTVTVLFTGFSWRRLADGVC